MSRIHWLWWLAIAMTLGISGITAWVLPDLPDVVPTHWNIKGQVDGHGSKYSLWLMPGIMVAMIMVFVIMPYISPKPFDLDGSIGVMRQMMVAIVAMMGYIQIIVILGASGTRLPIDRTMIAGMCLFMALLGNLMGKIKRNLYMGIRTPWTIANDRVWTDTHRLGAWLMVGAGVLGALICIALPPILAGAPLFFAVVIPVGYSYVLYQRLEAKGELESN